MSTAYRLPTTVTPRRYSLHVLLPLADGDADMYSGMLKIRCDVAPGHFVEGRRTGIELHCGTDVVIRRAVLHDLGDQDDNDVPVRDVGGHADADADADADAGADSDAGVAMGFATPRALTVHRVHDPAEAVVELRVPAGAVSGMVTTRARTYVIELDFDAPLRNQAQGLYIAPWQYGASKTVVRTLATQLQATGARLMYPCFDEPALKAVFRLVVELVPARGQGVFPHADTLSWEVLSNMPARSVLDSGRLHVFADTQPMSTYLLALVIAPLRRLVPLETRGGVKVSVWTLAPRDADVARVQHATALPRQFACDVLDEFTTMFGCPYPLPKCDLVPVTTFDAGAMENWGLITFRQNMLLVEADQGNAAVVMDTVAHELAHQWFGNLVTVPWWTDIWLNEAFATFAAAWVTARVLGRRDRTRAYASMTPGGVWLAFMDSAMTAVMATDTLPCTRPVVLGPQHLTRIRTARDLDQLFDDVAYAKGAVVLRLLFLALGERTFMAGLRLYMIRCAYGVADRHILWQCMTRAAQAERDAGNAPIGCHTDVAAMMEPWVTQPGVPILWVDKDGKLVAQSRLLRDVADHRHVSTTQHQQWPVVIGSSSRHVNMEFVNPGVAMCRDGDQDLLAACGGGGTGASPMTTLAHLLSLVSAVEAGTAAIKPRYIEFLLQCAAHVDDVIAFRAQEILLQWRALCEHASSDDVAPRSSDDGGAPARAGAENLVKACARRIAPDWARLWGGVADDVPGRAASTGDAIVPTAHQARIMATLAILLAGGDDKEVQARVAHCARALAIAPETVPVAMHTAALRHLIATQDVQALTRVYGSAVTATDTALAAKTLGALGMLCGKAPLERALHWATAHVPATDWVYLVDGPSPCADTRGEWLRAHWTTIASGHGKIGTGAFVESVLSHVASRAQLRAWESFFATLDTAGFDTAVTRALEKAAARLEAARNVRRQLCGCVAHGGAPS